MEEFWDSIQSQICLCVSFMMLSRGNSHRKSSHLMLSNLPKIFMNFDVTTPEML